MKSVRLGMMGAGKMGHWAARRIQPHPDARITALFDTHAGRCAALADEFDIPFRFTSAQELCSCDEVDAIYIALPNKFHVSMAKLALRSGKHVLLEKPFAMNAAEAEEIIAEANACDRVLMVGMDKRYAEDSQRVVALARAGALGDLYYGKAYWLRRTGIPKMGTWFGNKALAGAGALNDIGVHMLDLCLHAMDNFEPVSVYGKTFTVFGHRGEGQGSWGMSDAEGIPFDVDDFAAALIKFRNGAVVNLEVAWACHIAEDNRWNAEIFGTDGGASMIPGKWYRKNPDTGLSETIDPPADPLRFPHAEKFHNFINHLLGREELLVKNSEALAVQRILDAVAESCRTGGEVRIGGSERGRANDER